MRKKSIIKFSLLIIFFHLIVCGTGFSKASWKYYYKKGVVEYNAEIYDYAVENLLRALEENPSLFKAANIIAEIYLKQKNKEEAIRFYDISLNIDDKQPDIHCSIGELYEFYLEYDLSFKHYQGAVTVEPSHIKGHYNLVRFYVRKKDAASADKHFNICNNLGKQDGEEYFNKALDEEYKNDNKAIELYALALEKNPVLVRAYYRLSEIYRRREDYKNAISALEKIKELRPQNETALIHLGHLYMAYGLSWIPLKTKDALKRRYILNKARSSFEEAIRLKPDDPELYYQLSEVYFSLGEEDKAMAIQAKGISLQREGRF